MTVGAPYYEFFAVVFGLPLVLLMGLGPLVAWRRASLRSVGASVVGPAATAVVSGGLLVLAGAGSSPAGVVGYTFSVFVLAAIVLEFARGTRARKALGSEGWLGAFASLVGRNRRRYGGYVVHAAVVLLVVGAIGIGAYSSSREARLAPGQTVAVGDYSLRYLGSRVTDGANAEILRARFEVRRGSEPLGVIAAGKNRYRAEQETSNEVGIRSDLLRAEDLFVIADQFGDDGSVFVEVIVNPLVNLIWLSGFVFLLGSLVTMWPDAREQRRLARRFAQGPDGLGRTRASWS